MFSWILPFLWFLVATYLRIPPDIVAMKEFGIFGHYFCVPRVSCSVPIDVLVSGLIGLVKVSFWGVHARFQLKPVFQG